MSERLPLSPASGSLGEYVKTSMAYLMLALGVSDSSLRFLGW